MKILMLNDYMDSPNAWWRGAQRQTRLLSNALDADVNAPIDKEEYNIINFQDMRSMLCEPLSSAKKIATVRWHDPIYSGNRSRYNEMDGIIAVSEFVRFRLMEGGVDGRLIRVIPPCTEEDFPMPPWKNKVGYRICFIGAIEKRKGISEAMWAMASMSSTASEHYIPGIHLEVYGLGREMSMWQDFVRQNRLPVSFWGLIENPVLRINISRCDAFLLPSHEEAFGGAVLEPMMAKVPVIVSSAGGLTEVISNGYNGFVVYPKRVDMICRAVKELRKDREMAAKMAERAYKDVNRDYTVNTVARKTRQFYEDVLGGNR